MTPCIYHSGQQAVGFLVQPPDGYVAFKTSDLRKMGWRINDAECLRTLPRVDKPAVEIARGIPDSLLKRR